MKLIYGFMVDDLYVINRHGAVSPICEASADSLTFSLDTRHYQSDDYPGKDLLIMKSLDETTSEEFILTPEQITKAMQVYSRINSYAISHTIEVDLVELRSFLYGQMPELVNIRLGNLVEHNGISLPSFFTFSLGEDLYHIWLSDAAFQNQYPLYDIKVIPPVEDIDVFFTNLVTIREAVAARTSESLNQDIERVKNDQPYTYIRFLDFDYHYPPNPEIRVSTTWTVLIHGHAGDYIDNIKDALRDYILENSTHTEDEWREIFPEIFKRTEIILVPRWDKMAISNMDLLAGVYKSMMNLDETLEFTSLFVDFYTDAHVRQKAMLFPNDYKALSIVAVPGPDNREGATSLDEIFYDYIPVNTASLDFNRMRRFTKDWMIKLKEMLYEAEVVSEYSIIYNPHARRAYRNDKLFIAFMYDGVNYLIAARSNTAFRT
jgi:hypothetical protein